MTNFILFLLFGAGLFSLSLIGHKNYYHTTLYALAIGGIVNANYFHSANFPIDCFGLPLGIDSLIYTLFAFCVMTMLLQGDKRSAYMLALSSIVAIAFSACMELFSALLSQGSSPQVWRVFGRFAVSILANIVSVIVSVEMVARLKTKYNPYVCMACGIAVLSIVNTAIYFPMFASFMALSGNTWLHLWASLAGKTLGLLFSLIAFKLLNYLRSKMADKG